MKIFLLVLLLCLSTASQASECPLLESEGLSRGQVATLYRAFLAGRENDMSYSLAAIAWKESSAGLYLVNPNDPSSGAFHVTVRNAVYYAGWENTESNRQVMYMILQHDFDTAAHYAMLNLRFWRKAYGVGWKKAYQYYNGGRSYSKSSVKYSADIVSKIRVIQKCNWSRE